MRSFLLRALVPSPALAVAGAAFIARLEPQGNADLVWHLALGRFIATQGSLPDINAFYYTPTSAVGHDYTWGAQVLYYLAYRWGGPSGLAVLNALLAGGIVYLLYKMLERSSRNILLNLAMIALTHVAISPHLTGRTAAFTVLFLAATLLALSHHAGGSRYALWAIPAMTPFWVNLHLGVFLAPAILLVMTVFGGRERSKLLACLLAILLGLAVNPHTWRIYSVPYQVGRSLVMLRGLTEWFPPSSWSAFLFALLSAAVGCSLVFSRATPLELSLLGTSLVGAAIAERNLPLYAVAALWVTGRGYGNMTASLRKRWPFRRFEVSITSVGGWLWSLLIPTTVLIASLPVGSPFRLPVDFTNYPVRAADWVEESASTGNVFVREEWSGYMLWRFPGRRLFFDAKGGFDPVVADDHSELTKPGPRWREVADKYAVSTFLLETGSPLAVVLREARDWQTVWQDSVAEVFVRAE